MASCLLNINTLLLKNALVLYNVDTIHVYFIKLVLTRVNLICWICRYWGVRQDHHNKANEDYPYQWIWYEVSFFFTKSENKKHDLHLRGISWVIIKELQFIGLFICYRERVEKICDIRKNIKESIVVLLSAMHQLEIPFELAESEKSRDFILKDAGNPDAHITNVSQLPRKHALKIFRFWHI